MPGITPATHEQIQTHYPTTRRGSANRGGNSLWIAGHAIERFQERVAPVPKQRVIEILAAIAKTATVRSKPRHWMSGTVEDRPGTTYLYNSRIPDICLVVRDRCVVTIFTRNICRSWRQLDVDVRRTRVTDRGIPMPCTLRDLPHRPSFAAALAQATRVVNV